MRTHRSLGPRLALVCLQACIGTGPVDIEPEVDDTDAPLSLSSETKTPVCGDPKRSVLGTPWQRCAALDSMCMRGTYEPKGQCCFAEPAPEGTTCGNEVACNGVGKCTKPADSRDVDSDSIDDEKDVVLGGAASFFNLPFSPSLWFEDGAVQIRLDDQVALRLPTEKQVDLSQIDLRMNQSRTAVRVQAKTSWAEAHLQGLDTSIICYTTDADGEPKKLPVSSCDAPGVRKLACPGRGKDGFACEVDEKGSAAVLRGPGLRYAWLPRVAIAGDVRLLEFPWVEPSQLCPRCREGLFPPLRLRIERCNGIDDDGDGLTDENGAAMCDDRIACTRDFCAGSAGCQHTPNNGRGGCVSTAECAETRCAEPFMPGPNQRAEGPNENGCYLLLRDDFCTETWDGCQCNGPERCDPSAAAWAGSARGERDATPWDENKGCVAALPPNEMPCERINGDGNGCTIETCYEPFRPESCRLHRELQAQGAAAVRAYEALARVPSRGGESGVGGRVSCPNDPFRHLAPYGAFCETNNPCLPWECIANEGRCEYERLNGPVEGCSGVVARGCGELSCSDGACAALPRAPDVSDPYQCHGYAAAADDTFVAPTCLRNRCASATACTQVPEPSQCDDGNFCNGVEVCSAANVAARGRGFELIGYSVSEPGRYWGCGPAPQAACDDGIACTTDQCNEATDRCSNVPQDYVCHSARGISYDVCEPDYRCACEGASCGAREADGCSPLPAGTSPCDDHNVCTRDLCECADEFCTVPLCSHREQCALEPDWPFIDDRLTSPWRP